jgi:uncharacterized membrane protein YtjA (UPF0391 family)
VPWRGGATGWPQAADLFRRIARSPHILNGCEWGTLVSAADCFSHEATATRNCTMLGWVITFLVIALIAAILGFGGIAGVSIEIAKVIFFIAVVLFLISAIVGLARGRRL